VGPFRGDFWWQRLSQHDTQGRLTYRLAQHSVGPESLSVAGSAGLMGLQLGINFADSVKATTP
jgi:hypothetical protein